MGVLRSLQSKGDSSLFSYVGARAIDAVVNESLYQLTTHGNVNIEAISDKDVVDSINSALREDRISVLSGRADIRVTSVELKKPSVLKTIANLSWRNKLNTLVGASIRITMLIDKTKEISFVAIVEQKHIPTLIEKEEQ